MCAANLSEASQGSRVALVGGISTFSAACVGKPPASCFIIRKAGFPLPTPTAFALVALTSRYSNGWGGGGGSSEYSQRCCILVKKGVLSNVQRAITCQL